MKTRTASARAMTRLRSRSIKKRFSKNIKGGNALQPTNTAKTVRVRKSKPVNSDGPFAETKEQLGGFYLIDAKDMKEAMMVAAEIPAARFGSIEFRPIMTFS